MSSESSSPVLPAPARSVLITGAASGVGRAIALRMAQNGWRVFAGVRRSEDAEALVQEAGTALVPVLLDVTDSSQITEALALVSDAVGKAGLDGLVNCAGIAHRGPIETIDLEDLRRHFEVNVVGVVAVTRAFADLLRRGTGRIVNVSSVASRVTGPFWGAYTASKSALEAVTDSMRLELQPWGIHAVSILLGTVSTPIWDKAEDVEPLPDARARGLYSAAMEGRRAMDRKLAASAAAPHSVAKVVQTALQAPKPRTRYAIGWAAKSSLLARWLLSDRAMDGAMLSALKKP